jgi:membrane protein implicated in regulation of membrane protease activity
MVEASSEQALENYEAQRVHAVLVALIGFAIFLVSLYCWGLTWPIFILPALLLLLALFAWRIAPDLLQEENSRNTSTTERS